jgi:hypothetical protein
LEFTNRFRSPLVQYSWFPWLGLALYITALPFLWHVQYFKSPGAQFYRLILIVLPTLAVGAFVYAWVRKKGLWRIEPALFSGLLLLMCLGYEFRATIVILAMLAAAYGTGRYCLERLGVLMDSHAEDIAISSAVGFGLMASAMFAIGLVDGYYPWVMAALLVVPCVVFRGQIAHLPLEVRGAFDEWRGDAELSRTFVGVTVVFAAVFFVCTLMLTLAPSIAVDMMLFHLGEIKHYALTHGLNIVPGMPYSYFPQGGEVLMTLGYVLAGQAAAQMVNPVFFLLSLLLVYALARRLDLSRGAAVAGVIFAATLPFLHWTGSSFKNDFPLVLYQLGSLYCFIRNRDEEGDHWIYAGVFLLASSFGVKHTAAFGAVPLGLLHLSVTWRRPRLLLICFVIGLTFGFHWHARTYQLTGNALYPAAASNAAVKLPPMDGERPSILTLYLAYPWVVHFEGRRSFESPSNNPCGIFLVLFVPAWLWVRRKKRNAVELICLFAVAIHFFYLGWVWLILRYAIVPFMILVVLTMGRLSAFYESSGRLVRGSLLGAMVYGLIFALLPSMIVEINGPQLRYFAKRLDREQYLSTTVGYYPSIQYLRDNVPPDSMILSLNNAGRGFAPSPGRFHFISAHRGVRIAVDEAKAKLRRIDYDYTVVPTGMAPRFKDLMSNGYSIEQRHADPAYTVFAIERAGRGIGSD